MFFLPLQKQVLFALLVGIFPLCLLTLWYAHTLSLNQQEVHETYQQNQQLIVDYNQLIHDLQSLEKASKNNELLQNDKLATSINEKWHTTRDQIAQLAFAPSPSFVANWQQFQKRSDIAAPNASQLAHLSEQLLTLAPSFKNQLELQLNQHKESFANDQKAFLLGLVILYPLLIGLSLFLINRLCSALGKVDSAISAVGKGDFSKPIKLEGSLEMQQLGERLNWLNAELQRVQQQKETFLRHVTHELKTPLASLNEGVNLLDGEIVGGINCKQRRIVNLMSQAVDTLLQQIDALLNYSAASHPECMNHKVCMSTIQFEVEQHLHKRINSTNIEICWEVDVSIPLPHFPLKLILIQLLNNAILYAKTKAIVCVQEHNAAINLLVSDDGSGIVHDNPEQLFQPFVRCEKEQDKPHQSSGLGLAIVSECVNQLAGKLRWVPVKTGACIEISFPKEI